MKRPLVTVKTLTARVRDGEPIGIPENALITPAAEDWLRSAARSVKRVAAESGESEKRGALYIVGDDNTPTIRTLLPLLERSCGKVRMLPCYGKIEGCMDAIEKMCRNLAECNRRRGVVVVGIASIAACVANKFPWVRAATIAKPSELFDLQHRLGANALAIDPSQFSLRQLQATIESFARDDSAIEPVIEAAIKRAGAGGR